MKIDKITFQQTFPTGPYQNQKLGVEISFDDEKEFADDVFRYAKELCEGTFKKLNPNVGEVHTFGTYGTISGEITPMLYDTESKEIKDPKEQRIDAIITTINEAKEKKFVEFWRKEVERQKNDRLTVAFNKKISEFI